MQRQFFFFFSNPSRALADAHLLAATSRRSPPSPSSPSSRASAFRLQSLRCFPYHLLTTSNRGLPPISLSLDLQQILLAAVPSNPNNL
ncbi:hypothetical protein COCNU_scaffold005325G000020 [Cocos nucifera]|nr:hypothetical protein [Cocos nucifera]